MCNYDSDVQAAMRRFQAIADSIANTARMVQTATAGMRDVLQAADSLARLPEMMRRQNEACAFLMPRLAARSWYFGMNMTLSSMATLTRLAREEDYTSIDDRLMAWHRRHAGTIIERIAARFPDRRPVLEAALHAHEAGNYILCIPAFLAQADGVSHEYLTESFFRTRLWRERLGAFMEENSLTEFSSVMIIPLVEPGTIRQPTWEIEGMPGVLNRHQILHGLSSDYGSEINSLKCIGLLDYLYSTGQMILTRRPGQRRPRRHAVHGGHRAREG